MKTILIANPKGGCGKSTLSVNIAGYLANRGRQVAMLDLDRQQSSALWLATRPADLPHIRMLDSKKEHDRPHDWLVIDSPAGLHGKNLDHAVRLAHKIIVPVAPSLFDLQASLDFLKTLAEEKSVRKNKCQIGVVGMRMEMRTKAAWALEHFLATLDLPVLAYLRETQVYVNAAFEGKSLFDLPHHLAERELEQWAFMQGWLEKD
ncbi:MAG: cobyrinic acid a,c-diamide synthase [Gallionellales bacterium RIFCSPLOWO2_12_FULL_59_22]|nr:MAG: cobyrinic acid a,c-diamide synthase [Gallionellales bacterium RIFCSPLOWO2_02_FULL_59_110]OGT11600.1 MAG: cobyrinic acid a,c-diamide synthase [Gallionellales bacterium RIFCSPLOWO2_12_FULL_59_22]